MSTSQATTTKLSQITKQFDVHIGFEIHVQLKTKSKMFCTCSCNFGDAPNSNVCPICLGYPGALPLPNTQAVLFAYKIASALDCNISPRIEFDRKNYYYPDLPKNYQITQFYQPIGRNGVFTYHNHEQDTRSLSITEAHLEEDAGKLMHVDDITLCDYNRCGTPLLEVVTAPELHSAEEAESVLVQFRRLVRFLGVCDGNMEEGSLRCDVNISLNDKGKGLGSKVEIKNLNSFRFVRLAIEHEIERQSALLVQGRTILQQTRLWNENRDRTDLMRLKESSDDYRYFPEPDILPFELDLLAPQRITPTDDDMPEYLIKHIRDTYSPTPIQLTQIELLLDDRDAYEFFAATLDLLTKSDALPKKTALQSILNWIYGDVKKHLNARDFTLGHSPLSPAYLARLIQLVEVEQSIHGKLAKTIIDKIFSDNLDPDTIIKKYSLAPLSNLQLSNIVEDLVSAQPEARQQYYDGNKKIIGFFVGKIMQSTQGKADPQQVQSVLIKALESQKNSL